MAEKFKGLIEKSKKIDNGPPARYQLQLKRVNLDKESDEESKLRRFTFGERDARHQNKTILLVGATGAGKSTLINALVNFVMGVKFDDKVWFEVISDEKDRPQPESQTSAVSVYEVFGFEGTNPNTPHPIPFSLTIIDTPGLGDTRGLEHDDIIQTKLKDLFCIPEGVGTINAVGLVLKASENRLDERMAYIFNSVTSLFSKDMEKNIVVMMTHSDGGKPKNALKALKAAKILCARDLNDEPVYFQFNNRQNETIEEDSEEEEAQKAFQASNKGMEKFTDFLETAAPHSLNTTVEVMKKRIRLEACVQNLKERVTEREMKQEAIRKNREELLRFKDEIKKNKDFKVKVKETYKEKEKIKDKAVTCKTCEENCHYPGCTWAWIPSWCEVMKDGKCTSCSGKCPAYAHVKEKWRYVTKTRTVEKTEEEMKAKFEENQTKKKEKTTLLQDLEKEIAELEQQKNSFLNEAFIIIENLEKIALNEVSVHTYVHLDFLIEKMNETGDTEKVQKLKRMRDKMDEKNKSGAKYFMRYVVAKVKELLS